MNLTQEIEAIRNSPAHGTASMEHLFWKLIDVAWQMAKRIEKLEQQIVETNRHCKAMHTVGRGPQRWVDDDQG